MIDGIVIFFVIIGAFLALISAIGAIRLPDVYTRSHAISKSTTLGIMFILIGTFLYFWVQEGHFNSRLLLAIVFIFMTSPVAAHFISRAAYYSDVEPWEGTVRDDLRSQKKQKSVSTKR
jgi:multicomponent Na+:H+ antiporter subunit G